MKGSKETGFTFIEVLVFIIVTSILMSTLMLASVTALRKAPSIHQQWVGLETARGCMEWYLAKRRSKGYDALPCPSAPTDAACEAPTGYTVATNISCTTWNGESNYKTITVTVSGLASVTLSMQIGET